MKTEAKKLVWKWGKREGDYQYVVGVIGIGLKFL